MAFKLQPSAWALFLRTFQAYKRGQEGTKKMKERTQRDVGTESPQDYQGPDLEGALGVNRRAEVKDGSNR